MRGMLLFAIGTFMVFAAPIAHAQADLNKSGNAFLTYCGSSLPSQGLAARNAICIAYVMGLSEGIGSFADKGGAVQMYCSPEGVTAAQAFRLLARYIEDHPEKSQMEPRDLMLQALLAAFPCSKGK